MVNRAGFIGLVAVMAGSVTALTWGDSPAEALTTGALMLAVGVGFGLWSYRRGRHVPLAQAQTASAESGGLMLWKPGCVYCERLIVGLRGEGRVQWVNVKQDDDANALVRSLNDGNEYTPTMIVGDRVLRNPTARQVREALGTRAGS